jgi:antitoxin PrlF
MITSRLITKARTTIPGSIRAALCLKQGDELVYQIDGNRVILSRAQQSNGHPFRTFGEWSSQADNKAYSKL